LNNKPVNIAADIEVISRITAVPSLLDVICQTTGMGFAAIARVTEDQWVACAVRDDIDFGLAVGGELKVETTICHEIRQLNQSVVIDHVSEDAVYCNHPTPALYGFQSYISVPIVRKNGSFFGTLCAIDPKPNLLNNSKVKNMFRLFADLISFNIHNIEELELAEAKLGEERQTAELREQFIAILGHDLRNPVGAVSNVASILLRMPLDERTMRLAHTLQDSSHRMKKLIENVLDFAKGRLGEGIALNQKKEESIEEILNHVITELRLVWPERVIETEFSLLEPVFCDGNRIAQLLSNLLSNALSHGAADFPVQVKAHSEKGKFSLSVINAGEAIPAAIMEKLFQPFSRGEVKPGQQGLGLGLYIASEIARAHQGTIEVASTAAQTRFTLHLNTSGGE
jgi:signal transduction histidine kinase